MNICSYVSILLLPLSVNRQNTKSTGSIFSFLRFSFWATFSLLPEEKKSQKNVPYAFFTFST